MLPELFARKKFQFNFVLTSVVFKLNERTRYTGMQTAVHN